MFFQGGSNDDSQTRFYRCINGNVCLPAVETWVTSAVHDITGGRSTCAVRQISFGSLLGPTEFMAKGVQVLELPEDPRGGHALTSGHLLSGPPGCPFWVPGFTLVTEGRGTCTIRLILGWRSGTWGEVGGPPGYGLARLCAGRFVLWRAGQGTVAAGNGLPWCPPAGGPRSLNTKYFGQSLTD